MTLANPIEKLFDLRADVVIIGLGYVLVGSHSLCTVSNSVLLQDGPTPWAAADLGDNERKQKFLRLMGAGKVGLVIFYVDYFSQPSSGTTRRFTYLLWPLLEHLISNVAESTNHQALD